MTHKLDFETLSQADFDVAWRVCKRHYMFNGLSKETVKAMPGEITTRLLSLYYSGFLTAVDRHELGMAPIAKQTISHSH
jgi:hypothetical protein